MIYEIIAISFWVWLFCLIAEKIIKFFEFVIYGYDPEDYEKGKRIHQNFDDFDDDDFD